MRTLGRHEPVPLGSGVVYAPDSGYIMLSLEQNTGLPSKVIIDGTELVAKHEWHCSLLNARRLGDHGPVQERRIVEAIKGYLAAAGLEFQGFTGQFYHCTRRDPVERQSIIGLIGLAGIEELYHTLRQFDSAIASPVPHVTLYTEGSIYGIGIPNQQALTEYCRPLPSKVADELTSALLPQ